uniref:Tachykinin-related peptide 5 n=1 Tax=Rhyparobia maderae TaxID=36963 RepID=TRP5_RHYMA|nr:RecName: Full=Tachykinin-related peptide 5; Short=LemTRP 5 [Rhyparobia maderae]
APAMGFQGVR